MSDEPLSDTQVGDLLHEAMKLLCNKRCQTTAGATALSAAVRTLWLLGLGLVKAGEIEQMRKDAEDG